MINTEKTEITLSGGRTFTGDIPINCPYCGRFIEPVIKGSASTEYNDEGKLQIVVYSDKSCFKPFFACYLVTSPKESRLLTVYPPAKLEVLPESINKISPRFVELYNQCCAAELENHFELAGSGYRNALEVLIKDFAIKELSKNSDDVCKKTLYDAIGEYLPSFNLKSAADVVRILGNDFTHYERKYADIDFDNMKMYLGLFIKMIETEHLLKHPPVNANRK